MAPVYTGFKELANRVLISNEVSGISPYTLVKSTGESGYSFGWCQWDLKKGWGREINSAKENVGGFFEKLLRGAVDDNNKTLLKDPEVEDLLKKAQTSSFSSDDIKKVDGILNSTYGREKIDAAYSTYLDFEISEIDRKIGLTSYANVLSSNTFRLANKGDRLL